MRLAPSLLAADLADLAGALALCEKGGADLVHFDVMDGHFVPNLSFGIPVLKAVRARTRLPIDVHLMVSNPDRLLDDYLAAGASRVIVHWEAAPHLDRLLERIRKGGAEAGVAVNPATPVELLTDALPRLDFVLVMSVNPGFGGQAFLPRALDKARRLRRMIEISGLPVEIEMDGGIDRDNIARVVSAGVDVCVAGSAVFGAGDSLAIMAEMSELRERARQEMV
ncbi:MAG TPA: ribulose-phosphate 3-epimerase [Thermoanaerobaculia bacterium]|jgi:ribulose-phosphate 3-epimerase|nr:ribulose-phosphate 3-epimerase [Thermoanaerobaculia bacterium]